MIDKFACIADSCTDGNYKKIFKIISSRRMDAGFTADGIPLKPARYTDDDIEQIKALQFDTMASGYGAFKTLSEVRSEVTINANSLARAFVRDGFYNPFSGIGTDIDSGNSVSAYEPLLIAPYEASAMYSSSGLTQIIIDKKSKGVDISGLAFINGKMGGDKLLELKEYAESLGFGRYIESAVRDGLLFGGSVIYPIFKGDTPITTAMTINQLFQVGLIRQGCIDYFSEADRWNITVVPDYDISARDYLSPNSFYVPISGIEVNSQRASFIKTKPLPYWSAIRQLGWGASDIVGWAKSIMGYEIMAMSLPIMCQQMSLLVHKLPLDGIIAQNGTEAAKKWQKENEAQMRKWSILNPVAINSYGDLDVISRSYTGFDSLIDAIRKDVSAKCGIPESVLFYSQPNGIFNKSEDDVLLKQTETIKMVQHTVEPMLNSIVPFICASLWGVNSDEDWDLYNGTKISFDTPVVSSPSKKADVALKMAQAIQLLVTGGISVDAAIGMVSKVIGDVEMPTDIASLFNGLPSMEKHDAGSLEKDRYGNPDRGREGEL